MTAEICLIHTEGFEAREELVELARRKTVKLFRHHDNPIRLRLNLVRIVPHSGAPRFKVTALLERAGPDAVAHAEGAEPEVAVYSVMDILERMANEHVDVRQPRGEKPLTAS